MELFLLCIIFWETGLLSAPPMPSRISPEAFNMFMLSTNPQNKLNQQCIRQLLRPSYQIPQAVCGSQSFTCCIMLRQLQVAAATPWSSITELSLSDAASSSQQKLSSPAFDHG